MDWTKWPDDRLENELADATFALATATPAKDDMDERYWASKRALAEVLRVERERRTQVTPTRKDDHAYVATRRHFIKLLEEQTYASRGHFFFVSTEDWARQLGVAKSTISRWRLRLAADGTIETFKEGRRLFVRSKKIASQY